MNIKKVFFMLLAVLYILSGHSQTVNSDSLVPYRMGNKWGYSDMSGNIVIKGHL